VVTEVVEPRLACHLIKRGADDFIFKPTDYTVVAAKVEALLERRERTGNPVVSDEPPIDKDVLEPLNVSDMQIELQRFTENAIVTPEALDIYLVSRGEQYSTHDAVTAISRQPQLVSAVLELSNTAFFNPSGRHVVSVEDAVMLLGQNRIGELTLGMQLLSTVTAKLPLWLSGDWLKKRSLSAAITADWFIRHGDHESIRTGVLLSAIIHLLGRGLLASLYSDRYQVALSQCRDQQQRPRRHDLQRPGP
jgi:HD-like signal output (HDOD) protein